MRTRVHALLFVFAGLTVAGVCWKQWRNTRSTVEAHTYVLEASEMPKWQEFGGSWQMASGTVQSLSNERGAKLLTGSPSWRNYTIAADIRFDGKSADMGLIVRSQDESRGVDAFNGYYVGLRSLDETLVVGRADYGWVEARPVPMPGGIQPAEWYRLRVTAYNCNIAASAQNLRTKETAWIAFEERSCIRSGRVGLRSLNTGTWRNIAVTDAGASDYQDLQRHADSVEQPVVLNGPPWWTPRHVTMLFAVALTLALLTQLAYFRVQRWKTYTIMQERERLAHEIHDTMAQSFAGVGYQIQGIRSSLVRGDAQNLVAISDQLNIAFQLVRRCHEDASRTITMLANTSPETQEDLLGALERTAQRLAGEGIRTVTQLHGRKVTLKLRVADALLHIGQEAIANAVTHSGLSLLKIQLKFEESFVELLIQDDGVGFEYTSESEGFGILGMQKRSRAVSGNTEIVSSPGNGTIIRTVIELEEHRLRRWLIQCIAKIA